MIGTARSPEFRERRAGARPCTTCSSKGIDRLIVIGGDGSLQRRRPAASRNGRRWSPNCSTDGAIDQQTADRHPALMIAGLVGSIDNDMIGTDMTIGADSALHRIVEAIDAICQHRGQPPAQLRRRGDGPALRLPRADERDRRRRRLRVHPGEPARPGLGGPTCASCSRTAGRPGRRNSIVVVAEGAQDSENNPISSDYVRQVLEDRLGEDTRVTILGHVQRGGAPSAFDRSMSSHARSRGGRGGAGGNPGQRPAADRHPGTTGCPRCR